MKIDTFVLHFAFDRTEIRSRDGAAFREFIGSRFGTAGGDSLPGIDSILIAGYTDTVGEPGYNYRLSMRRAQSAASFFQQSLQADHSWMTRIEAHGEDDPLPGDDSASRRVTITCFYHPAPPPVTVRADTPRPSSEPDTVFGLDDIRFHANTDILTDSAELELPRYIDYLLTLKDHFLEIDGYCNSPGPPLPPNDPLYILSTRRAKFIYDRLLEKGFDPQRLVYKGRGNTNPRQAHPTTRGEMDQNMRVEIRVFKTKPE